MRNKVVVVVVVVVVAVVVVVVVVVVLLLLLLLLLLIIIIIIIIIIPRVYLTANFIRSLKFFWVFWSISTILWMVLIRPLISNSSSLSPQHFETVPSAPIIISITITLMFHSFFSSLARSKYFFSHFDLFSFYSMVFRNGILPLDGKFSHFLLLSGIRWSVCISKSQRILYVSFSTTDSGLCIYKLVLWSNCNALHHSQSITFLTQSCLLFYFFCVNLQQLLTIWLTVTIIIMSGIYRTLVWWLECSPMTRETRVQS